MIKSAVYFVKFSFRHRPKYLVFSCFDQICISANAISGIIFARLILDALFEWHKPMQAVWCVVLLGLTNLVLQSLENIFHMYAVNEKNELRKEFELFLYGRLASCDYEKIESPLFLERKEKAEFYIGGQWGEFGKQLDILFELFGNVVVLGSMFVLLLRLRIEVVLCFLVLFVLNNFVSSHYKKKSTQMQMNEMPSVIRRKKYYEGLTQDIPYVKEIRINGLADWIMEQYRSYMKAFTNVTSKIYRCNFGTQFFTGVTDALKLVVTYGYLLYAVLHGTVTVGEFTMLLSAVTMFNDAVSKVIMGIMDISRYNAYYEAFDQYVNLPAEQGGERKADDCKGCEIAFCNVSFRYPGREEYVLKDFSAVFHANKRTMVIGKNGEGKTTLVKLMMGLYPSYEGEILLNGVNIREFNIVEYRKFFSAAFQDYMLYAFSLRENIALADASTSEDQAIEAVLDQLGFSKKLGVMDKKLDTQVFKLFDEHGVEFSGGEGQKVGIARAFIKHAPVIILDEPTAMLDPRAERDIYMGFDRLVQEQTVIYISHRLALAKACDEIIVIENGKAAEVGTHDQLIQRNGIYAEMYRLQAEQYRAG